MSDAAFPVPHDEPERLASLTGSRLLEESGNPRFDRLVRLASELTQTPIALVTLLDDHLQHLFAAQGLSRGTMPREDAFCTYTILQDDVFVVEDATQDARFADNPLVTGEQEIRFYAGAPLRASDGHYVGAVCVLDRTPRSLDDRGRQLLLDLAAIAAEELRTRRLVEEHAAVAAERDRLIRTLAHDLRSPLGGIAGLAELLGEEVESGSEAQLLVQAISDSASAALNVASATLARMVEPHDPGLTRTQPVDLAALAEEVAVVHQPAAAAKRQRIVVEGTAAVTSGDPVRLHHALANLVSNALKFSPPNTTITLHTGVTDGQASVSVQDEGPGLGDVNPSRLFEPFEKGPARPTDGEPSTGLGLSIVRDLARLHGGDVQAETAATGGARFTVTLPATEG
jgi:two-component system, sensor histidine kinase